MQRERLKEIYQLLYSYFGPQHWWPGQTRFEIIIGAILAQNTNWANVEKAIMNLKTADCLSVEKLNRLDLAEIAKLIKPAGYYNIKAKRLKNFLDWLFDKFSGRLENLENLNTSGLREELLSIKGIGPETADSILLYAFDRPVFVIDAYTARVAARHHLVDCDFEYYQLQNLFESNLPGDVKMFNEYHALLVRLAKKFCKTRPICAGCPLEKLPHTIQQELF